MNFNVDNLYPIFYAALIIFYLSIIFLIGYAVKSSKVRVKCKKCNGYYIKKKGRFGPFYSCINYPKCVSTLGMSEYKKMLKEMNNSVTVRNQEHKKTDATNTKNQFDIYQEIRPTEYKCEKCGGQYIIKTDEHGPFAQCSNYSTCRSTITINELNDIIKEIEYINKFEEVSTHIVTNSTEKVKCKKCNGNYEVYDDISAKCSNHLNCDSVITICEFVKMYIEQHGIKIYKWNRHCYKCHKKTPIYSYYLLYDLAQVDDYFKTFSGIGIGDLPCIDEILREENDSILFIKNGKEITNFCVHCNSLQGHWYIVEDPHDILQELHNNEMDKYYYKTIHIKDTAQLYEELKDFFPDVEY